MLTVEAVNSEHVEGARLVIESVRFADEAAIQADKETRAVLARLYLARRKSIMGTNFFFLFDALRRNATIRFVENAGSIRAQVYTTSFMLVAEYELDEAIKAERAARIEPTAVSTRSIADEAYAVAEPAAFQSRVAQLGIRALTKLGGIRPGILTLRMDREALPEEKTSILMIAAMIKRKYPLAYFQYIDADDQAVQGMDSETVPVEHQNAKRVVIDVPSVDSLKQARDLGGDWMLPVQRAERTGQQIETVPFIGVFIAGILLASHDAKTLASNDLSRQFMRELTQQAYGFEEFSSLWINGPVEDLAKRAKSLLYIAVKRMAMAIDIKLILRSTQMALQVLGSAA